MARSYEEKVALFRYGVIADLIHVPPGKGSGLEKKLQEIGNKSYEIPGSRRTQVAAETARQWLYRYRHGGFEALQPKRRAPIRARRATCPRRSSISSWASRRSSTT